LAGWGASPAARYLDHHQLAHHVTPLVAGALVGGWTLMILAMMLPTTAPLVGLFATVVANKPNRRQLVASLIGGFMLVWLGAGVLAEWNDAALHHLIDSHPWLASHTWTIGSGVFAMAGLYQFSTLKYRCLDRCRLPRGFIQRRWTGNNEPRQAFRIGMDHGLSCLGCCWALMLLMFSLGMGNLGWMFGLAAVMAAEKNLAAGRRVPKPIGGALILIAIASAAGHL
jgi:predicted metal-binding membrane protein